MSAGPSSSASASTDGYGMPAWYARAALQQRLRAQAMSASMARASMRPGRMVRTGDVITVALDRRVRVLRVRGLSSGGVPPPAPRRYMKISDEAGCPRAASLARHLTHALGAKLQKSPFRVCK